MQCWEYCLVYSSSVLLSAGTAERSASYEPAIVVEFSDGQKAEYRNTRAIVVLGQLGGEGWEVVSSIHNGSSSRSSPIEWTLKRPLTGEQARQTADNLQDSE